MSVHWEPRASGGIWKVRWRQGGRQRAATFDSERDALDFDAKVRLARRSGELAQLDAGRVTLEDYAEQWWRRYAEPNLAVSTQAMYALQLDRRIVPTFGGWQLREIAPEAVEAMRRWLLERDRLGDATLVSLLAYAGPRPESEGVTLTWPQIRDRTLLIRASKRHGIERTTRLLAPLAEDLGVWREAAGRSRRGLVFPFGDNGVKAGTAKAWTGDDWDNWRERVFRPACDAAGLDRGTRPRDLRGSFASLLIWEGQTVVEVAAQLGHSSATCLRNYAAVFAEFDPEQRRPAEHVIREARGEITSPRDAMRLVQGAAADEAAVFPAGSRSTAEEAR
jgi:integrase